MNAWDNLINNAVRSAKISIVGASDIKNWDQATVSATAIKAFGNSPSGFIYIEPRNSKTTKRPIDLLICHQELGLLFIEVKGFPISNVQSMRAGKMIVDYAGAIRELDPIDQVEEAMFAIKKLVSKKLLKNEPEPLFSVMVAFPKISESEWTQRGLDKAYSMSQVLLKEHCENPSEFKKKIHTYIASSLSSTGKRSPLNISNVYSIQLAFGDTTIDGRRPNQISDQTKLGAYIDAEVAREKHLSLEQQELSRIEVGGHPRLIRGVAGSGKSIVLANLIARYINRKLHTQNSLFDVNLGIMPKVAVICFNKTLVPYLQEKIESAYTQQTFKKIPDEVMVIRHMNGFQYDLSQKHVIKYIPVKDFTSEERAEIYQGQLVNLSTVNRAQYNNVLFDAIFVDEGQDFSSEEYSFLLELIKTDPNTQEKTLTIFYDDAQNLYAKTRPVWKQMGIDVQRGDRSRVMKKCFRNTKEVIEFAFNILVGTQAEDNQGIQNRSFADISSLRKDNLIEGSENYFTVNFAERKLMKPAIMNFNNRVEEKNWIGTQIARLIEQEEVRAEDILILFHRSSDFSDLPKIITQSLHDKTHIKGFKLPYTHGNPADQDKLIFETGHLTICTTYSAKGYDAPIVFVVGTDLFDNDEKGRASFYVGATRAKIFLYVTGISNGSSLMDEAEKLGMHA